MKYCIDTNILIWGVRQVAETGQEGMISHARAFLEWAERHGHILVITSQIAAEYLVGGTGSERDKEFAELTSKFQIFPFDALASRIAAEIRSDKEFLKDMQKRGKTKACVISDITIVATAKSARADKIFSNDGDILKAAQRCGLPASNLPSLKDMLPLSSSPAKGRTREILELFPENSDKHSPENDVDIS